VAFYTNSSHYNMQIISNLRRLPRLWRDHRVVLIRLSVLFGCQVENLPATEVGATQLGENIPSLKNILLSVREPRGQLLGTLARRTILVFKNILLVKNMLLQSAFRRVAPQMSGTCWKKRRGTATSLLPATRAAEDAGVRAAAANPYPVPCTLYPGPEPRHLTKVRLSIFKKSSYF